MLDVMYVCHPVLLFPGGQGYDGQVYSDTLERAARSLELWWEQYGIYVHMASPKVILREHGIDLKQENPWGATLRFVQSLGYPAGHLFILFLRGWNAGTVAGWGAPPLALMGDQALSRLASPNINDDRFATWLMGHEGGHAMGLAHDFVTPNNIMGYSSADTYPNCILGPQRPVMGVMAATRRLLAGRHEPVGCLLPDGG